MKTLAFSFLLASLLAAVGCSSSSDPLPTPPPTATDVMPADGTSLGGTTITVTGNFFLYGVLSVTVGGNPATDVTVLNNAELTCKTPAGMPASLASIQILGAGGIAVLPDAFAYHATPTVTAIVDDRGSASGGLDVTITGTGFVVDNPGMNVVTIGGAPATGVLIVDDAMITCTTPAGTAGTADVTVTNDNGSGTLAAGFTYIAPQLYAADGRSGTSGNLYLIDVTDGSATTIGAIGFPITGLAFSRDGTLFGVTSANAAVSTLVTIDLMTGAGTAVGTLQDAGMTQQGCTDITFIGTRLLGWGQPNKPLNQRALEIDPLTALVTDLGGGSVGGGGNAFEADAAGALRLIRTFTPTRTIFDVDPITGVATQDKAVTPDGNVINSMAFLDGVLYCVDSNNSSNPPNDLATIDVATGALTKIGALPSSVDGIAGTVK